MKRCAMVCLAVGLASCPAMADRLHLADGSVLVGELVELHGGSVTFKTNFAGELTLPLSNVQGLDRPEPTDLLLDGNQQVTASVAYRPGQGHVLQAEGFGERSVSLEQISSAWRPDAESPAQRLRREQLEAKVPTWSVEAALGFDGQTGNSEIVNLNAGLELRRTTPTERLRLFGEGRWSQEDGDVTAHEIIGGLEMEKDITDRWFAFGKLQLETDEIEELELRTLATVGAGYFFIREPDQELKLRGGPGFQHESYRDGTSEAQAIAELALDYRRDFNDWLSFEHNTTYYPTFEELSDYRLVMRNSVEVPLTDEKDWKVQAGVRNEFDDRPAAGVDRLDTYYFLNLVWEYN